MAARLPMVLTVVVVMILATGTSAIRPARLGVELFKVEPAYHMDSSHQVLVKRAQTLSPNFIFDEFKLEIPSLDSTNVSRIGASNESYSFFASEAAGVGMEVGLSVRLTFADDDSHYEGNYGEAFNDTQWDAFFANYRPHVLEVAELAESAGVGLLAIGYAHFFSQASRGADYAALLAEVRSVFSGNVTYCMDHGSLAVGDASWFDDLDVLCVLGDFSLASGGDWYPSRDSLVARWRSKAAEIKAFSDHHSLPVLMVSVGFSNAQGTVAAPYARVPPGSPGTKNYTQQAEAFDVFLSEAFAQSEAWIAGIVLRMNGHDIESCALFSHDYLYNRHVEPVIARYFSVAKPLSPTYRVGSAYTIFDGIALRDSWEFTTWSSSPNHGLVTDEVLPGANYSIDVQLLSYSALVFYHDSCSPTCIDPAYNALEVKLKVRTGDPPIYLEAAMYDDSYEKFGHTVLTTCDVISPESPNILVEDDQWYTALLPLSRMMVNWMSAAPLVSRFILQTDATYPDAPISGIPHLYTGSVRFVQLEVEEVEACRNHTECGACVADPLCGWCDFECRYGNELGTSSYDATCPSESWNYDVCPEWAVVPSHCVFTTSAAAGAAGVDVELVVQHRDADDVDRPIGDALPLDIQLDPNVPFTFTSDTVTFGAMGREVVHIRTTTAGVYQVTATLGGLPIAAPATLTVAPGPVALSRAAIQGPDEFCVAEEGTLTVALVDSFDNLAYPADTYAITVTAFTSPANLVAATTEYVANASAFRIRLEAAQPTPVLIQASVNGSSLDSFSTVFSVDVCPGGSTTTTTATTTGTLVPTTSTSDAGTTTGDAIVTGDENAEGKSDSTMLYVAVAAAAAVACSCVAIVVVAALLRKPKKEDKFTFSRVTADDEDGTVRIERSPGVAAGNAVMTEYLSKLLNQNNTDLLGEGASGKVYRALPSDSKEWVAVKLLREDAGEVQRAEFQNEVVILSRLSAKPHPNIIGLKFFCDVPPAIGMECATGGSLHDIIATKKPVTLEMRYSWAVKIARGMAHLHACNIVHLDLKPRNVILTDSGEVKITDFGISKMDQPFEMTDGGAFSGTVQYTAPERYRTDAKVDLRAADVYSYGMTLYSIASGLIPFQGMDQTLLVSELSSKRDFRPEFSPDADGTLRSLAEKAWAMEPAARPSFAMIVEALEQADQAGDMASAGDVLCSLIASVTSQPHGSVGGPPPSTDNGACLFPSAASAGSVNLSSTAAAPADLTQPAAAASTQPATLQSAAM